MSVLCFSDKEEAEELPHKFLGRAVVDLTPLRYGLAQISGWYNVVDLGGSVHGQLKVNNSFVVLRYYRIAGNFRGRNFFVNARDRAFRE